MEKRCFKCLCVKPLTEFYKHAQMGDGHLNKCKVCTCKDVSEHRQREWERVRAYDRMRASQPHRVAANRETAKEWRAEHPNRRSAQVSAGNAIRSGKLVRWPVCSVPTCDEPRPQAHHPDYDQPLEVVWLCASHHKLAHAASKPF